MRRVAANPHKPVLDIFGVDCVWNVMAHAQKPDFVFRRNGRVYLNRRGRQFSRLLAAEVYASTVVMLDTPCSHSVKSTGYPLHSPVSPSLPPPVRHRVPSHFNWTLPLTKSSNSAELLPKVRPTRGHLRHKIRLNLKLEYVQIRKNTL
jgi:hypothetical protein